MLINLHEIIQKYNMNITGIIHVGAHWGEEYDDYKKAGVEKIIFIEPAKKAFNILIDRFARHPDIFLCNVACGSPTKKDEFVLLNIETKNTGQSNSILKAKKHLEHYPDITFNDTEQVRLSRLDDVFDDIHFHKNLCGLPFEETDYNLLMMDVQGYELEVLKSSLNVLTHINYVYTEINTDELYEGCAKLKDLDEFLNNQGFTRVETKLTDKNWGDALYVRK